MKFLVMSDLRNIKLKEHRIVDHSKREWAKGDVHINGCGNRNVFLRAYLRRHRDISKKYLQGYLDFLSLILTREANVSLILFGILGR